jgi:hypothetical protein
MVVGVLILIVLLLGLLGDNPRLPKFGMNPYDMWPFNAWPFSGPVHYSSASGVIASGHLAVTNFLSKVVALAGLQLAPSLRKVVIVEAVSLDRAEVVLADGSIWPIIDWFDDEGDHCGRHDYPVVAVIGNDITGYSVIDLNDFEFGGVVH